MRRVVVAGGTGLFGGAAVALLQASGLAPVVASRRADAALRLDVEDPASLRAGLRPGDIVIDAAGPFGSRTTCLLDAALEVGCDLIDLCDAPSHARRVSGAEARIEAAGRVVLPGCSSVSAVSAAAVRLSGVAAPTAVWGFLAPAAQRTARSATSRTLMESIGRPVEVWRDGRPGTRPGWRERRRFDLPAPIGRVRGRLFGSADAVWLPRAWPSLQDVSMYVTSHILGGNLAIDIAARVPPLRWLLSATLPLAVPVARWLGRDVGYLGFVVEGAGQTERLAFAAPVGGHEIAVLPAVMAAEALATDTFEGRGLVPPEQQVDPEALVARLATLDIALVRE